MDTTVSNALAGVKSNSDAVAMAVLKKANEAEGGTAMQLIAASATNMPEHLGRNVNTVA